MISLPVVINMCSYNQIYFLLLLQSYLDSLRSLDENDLGDTAFDNDTETLLN